MTAASENVELVRRIYDAFAAGDNTWPFEVYDRDIEWDVRRSAGSEMGFKPVYRGHDGVRDFWRQWLEASEWIHGTLDDVIEAGDEVVALVSQVNRGRASGADVQQSYAQVWTVRAGKVVRMRVFADRAEALRAVGLE